MQIFLSIGEMAMKMAAIMTAPSPSRPDAAPAVMKLRAQTLQATKAKRTSSRFSGRFNTTSRARATTAAGKWQKAGEL